MRTRLHTAWTAAVLLAVSLVTAAFSAETSADPSARPTTEGAAASSAALKHRLEDLQQEMARLQSELTEVKKQLSGAAASSAQAVATAAAVPAAPSAAALDQTDPAPAAPATPAGSAAQGAAAAAPAPTTPDPSVSQWGPAVNGIYTAPETKDLGVLTGVKRLEGLKFRGWISAYYDFNFNTPTDQVVNANQGLSVVKARNATIEGRTFDVHSNSLSLELAEIEVEKVPVAESPVGFKFDLAFGDTQDIIADTIAASAGFTSISQFDKTFQHASISYLAPVGKGLRIDFGKFVTHIGGETIENIKNNNFSHAFFYTYAIPFQDTGLRFHYDWSAKAFTEFYALNGWNVTFDNNRGKTFSVSQGWTPGSKLSVVGNWMGGPEQTDNSRNWRHLGDFQVNINPSARWKTLTNIDVAWEKAPLPRGQNAKWDGAMEMVRYQVSPRFSPAFRFEWYRDPQGFTTGVPQNLLGYTVTLDYQLGNGAFDRIMIRPEWRYDHSTANFFSRDNRFQSTKHQQTVGVAVVYYF